MLCFVIIANDWTVGMDSHHQLCFVFAFYVNIFVFNNRATDGPVILYLIESSIPEKYARRELWMDL